MFGNFTGTPLYETFLSKICNGLLYFAILACINEKWFLKCNNISLQFLSNKCRIVRIKDFFQKLLTDRSQTFEWQRCVYSDLRGVSSWLSSSSGSLSHSQRELRFLFLHSQLCLFPAHCLSRASSGPRADDWNRLPSEPMII